MLQLSFPVVSKSNNIYIHYHQQQQYINRSQIKLQKSMTRKAIIILHFISSIN